MTPDSCPGLRRRRIRTVLWISAAAAIVCFAAAPLASVPVFVCRRADYDEYPEYGEDAAFSAELTLVTDDGQTLWGGLVEAVSPEGAVIMLSGIDGPPVSGLFGFASFLSENGITSLLLELRAHGKSSGRMLGMGYTEVADISAAVEALSSMPGYGRVPITVLGFSMGGAAAVNAFGQNEEIDGLVAVSAYSSFDSVIFEKAADFGVPGFLASVHRPFIMLSLRILYGSSAVEKLRPVVQIQNAADRPVFLIACEDDPVVSSDNTKLLAQNCPDAAVWIREGSDHLVVKGGSFTDIPEDSEFCEAILLFISGVTDR
ncbi:MAG: alpha/beta hydrolase [Eubacteriales bacterium]